MRGLGEAQEGLGRYVPSSSGFQQLQRPRSGDQVPALSVYTVAQVSGTSKNGSGLPRKRLPAVVMRLV